MTKSRKAYEAFYEKLATEQHRPFRAIGFALFLGFNAFTWIMGFMLGVVPLTQNIYNHMKYYVIGPMNSWFQQMGWEGFVTVLAIQLGVLFAVLYISRNYLALVAHGAWMKLVDFKNYLTKKEPVGPNVRPLRRKEEPVVEAPPQETLTAPPPPPPIVPTQRVYELETAVVAG